MALKDLTDDVYGCAADIERRHTIDAITSELRRRGLKAGGTKLERANRLFAVSKLKPGEISAKFMPKKKVNRDQCGMGQ